MRKIIYLYILLFFTACAQYVPPTGGKKDIIPPKLVNSIPLNKEKKYSNKTINLLFDEFIEASSINQELIITPKPKGTYVTKVKDKSVKLTFTDNLDSNTTYTFNFRKGIKDVNEKNPAQNLKIVISTGVEIDSLSLEGSITDIHTKKPVYDVTVGLYIAKDTVSPLKSKPLYFTKTDSLGKYTFENLKSDNYKLLAFTDINGNLNYDQKNERFGFISDTISLVENKHLENIEIYKANYTKNKIKKVISREDSFLINLEKNIKNIKLNFENKKDSLAYMFTQNTVTLYKNKNISSDTINVSFTVTDSLFSVDTLKQKIFFQPIQKTTKKKEKPILSLTTNIKDGSSQPNKLHYIIKFDTPIIRFDTNAVVFKTDTIVKEKFTLNWPNSTELHLNVITNAKKQTELIFPSNTFSSLKGDTNDFVNLKVKILQTNELGSIKGVTKTKKGTKIVQLLRDENMDVVVQEIITEEAFTFLNIIPDSYRLKIIYDENKNGIWDPGNFTKNTLPEKISITKEPIKIKANFEIQGLITE